MMSFGFSPSDIALVITLAVKAYTDYTKSAREFEELAEDIDSFKATLEQARLVFIRNRPNAQQSEALNQLYTRSKNLLEDLNDFCKGYASLGSTKQRKWDRLRWSPSDADEFRKRIRDQRGTWNFHISCIISEISWNTNEYVQDIRSMLNRLPLPRNIGFRQGSFLLEYPTESKNGDDSRWNQIPQGLVDSGGTREDIQVKENIGRQTSGQKQSQSRDIPCEIIIQDCKGEVNLGDAHVNMELTKLFSRSSTFAGMGELEETPSSTSGDTNKSGEVKRSFLESLPRDAPLAFDPTKQTRRPKIGISVVGTPAPSRRKLSLSLPKITKLGSSAPSMAQQPSPFGGSLTSLSNRSRSSSAVSGSMSFTSQQS